MERIKVKAKLKAILKKRYEDSRSDLPGGTGVDIETILSDSDFIRVTRQLADGEFRKNLSTEQFIEIYESISSMAGSLKSVNERVEVEHFLKDGYKLDFDGLTQSYIDHNLKLKFPDLDIRKLCDLYEKPPTKLQTYYSKTKFIKIDSFVFRKFMLAMIQMVFNQMDILCVYTGSEGCLSGDTLVQVSRAKNSYQWTMKKLYEKVKGITPPSKNGLVFNQSIPIYTRSFNGKEVRLHKIKDVMYSGKKKTYTLKLKAGQKIRATETHKFLTPNGWVPLSKLVVGNKLMIDNFSQGFPGFSEITSIGYFGEEDTYDIECEEPYHNFVANGIIAHNSGKSTKASQDMLMLHWFLTEIGVIKYAYKIENMFFNSLASFQDAEDRYFKEPFRILCLDEGNQLNRQEWKSEEVKTFFQRLRRERYNQRIKFICIPVLGEMLTSIVQSRVNFVFDGYMKTDVKTGQLVKGRFKMFVIPRDETIYSPAQKRDLSGDEIRTKLHDNLKDQNYRKGIDPSLVIKRFEANGVWGFKEEDYKEKLKESNAHFSVKKGMTISELDAFMIYKTNITGKRLGLGSKDLRYRAIAKVLSKINVMFEDNPDLYSKYERAYKRKMSRRGDLPPDVIEADDDEEESVKEILHEKPEKD